jgi:hypothetical protein
MMTKEERKIAQWMRKRMLDAERAMRVYARDGFYGDAQLTKGHAEAYAFTILHIETEAKRRK